MIGVAAGAPAAGLPPTIAAAAAALASRALSAVELTRAAIAAADRLDGVLGVYLARTDEAALAAAAAVDAARAAGTPLGPLAGIPVGVKDIISTSDAPTTAQSLVLDPAFGRQGDAPVVARLRAAGAIVTGKLTTMEFAIGCPDPEQPFPLPRNPWSLGHWAGGSSSGTGSGLAAGLFLGGLGTDTGGSIRLPAAWCGVTGLKPTFGLVPKSGVVPLSFSLDHVGPMARTAFDCALLLVAIAGHHAADACAARRPVPDVLAGLDGDVSGLRLGVDPSVAEAADAETGAAFAAAVAVLAGAGATIHEIRLPLVTELEAASGIVVCAEAFAYHRASLRERWNDYGASTRATIATGALTTAADLVQAQRVRRAGVRALQPLFAGVDAVLTPTCFGPARRLDDLDFASISAGIFTQYWNAVGAPAVSAPMGLASGLPVGLQIAGPAFADATVLRIADAFQRRTGFHRAVPPSVRGTA